MLVSVLTKVSTSQIRRIPINQLVTNDKSLSLAQSETNYIRIIFNIIERIRKRPIIKEIHQIEASPRCLIRIWSVWSATIT